MSVEHDPHTPRPTGGIDWASENHAVAVVGPDGTQTDRFTVAHTAAGLAGLCRRLTSAEVHEVAIERVDGPVVDALLEAGLTVFVIAPNQVKNLRGRYGSAGNKDDRFDAFVLADTVRTDRRRLRPLQLDHPATVTLRATCRARRDLVIHRVGLANQLRAHLQISFPAAVGLFARLDSPVSLAFLNRFPDQRRADWLSPVRLQHWLGSIGYSGRQTPEHLHDCIDTAPRGVTGPDGDARALITLALVAALQALRAQITVLDNHVKDQLARHPDANVFISLPRAGQLRAARLLAEIGDARGRFPDPDSLACQAGVAPSPRQSGKVKIVSFRWAADKQLRDAVCDFAADSRRVSPWAADLYQRARARGHDHPHAVRILARAWLRVIWKCWQSSTPYDPTRHGAAQALNQHQQAAG
jgi:transposase